MLPVNLLALDSAHFDTNLKAGQGVQPPDTGFSVAFGNLMQAPGADGRPLATFPVGSDMLTSWSVPEGEVLPLTGNGLPPSDPVALPGLEIGIEVPASEILENPGALDALAGTQKNAPGAIAPATTIASQTGLPELPAGISGSPAGKEPPTPATALPAAHRPGAATETIALADAAHSSVLRHIRYLTPGADAPAARVADAGAADTLRRAAAELRPQPIPATPPVTTGVQEFAQQVTDAARASSALTPAGAEALLQGDVQDLRPAPPSVAALPSIATSSASPAANATPSPAAPLHWSGTPIDIAPGQPGWNEALGDRVMWMAGNRIQNAELRLNPAELGPLRVQISMDDGNATVTFTAQHPLTRDAIEQALPRLREMLADQGLSLQNASVNDQGPRHQQAGPGGENAAPQFGSGHGADGGLVDGENLSPVMRVPSGLVDVFA